jgi:RimJ/RimL family protein N-acetyltransferase
MVGYDGWMNGAVSVHVAVEYPAALRHVLRPGFGIPFTELGMRLVLCQVLSTNAASIRMVKHLGFKEVFRGREWYAPGVDLVFFEMRRSDCRWIPQDRKLWAL